MKHWLGKIAICSSIVFGSSALCQQATQVDANNLHEAASKVYTLSQLVPKEMEACQTVMPRYVFMFQVANYEWHGRNYKVILAAEKILGDSGKQALAPSVQGSINTTVASVTKQTCSVLSAQILNRQQDVQISLPKAYGFLIKVYGATPAFAGLVRRQEFQDGCVLQYASKVEKDLATGIAHCGCLTESFSGLSQQEQNDFTSHAKDPAYVSAAPWAPTFRENAKACLAAKQIP